MPEVAGVVNMLYRQMRWSFKVFSQTFWKKKYEKNLILTASVQIAKAQPSPQQLKAMSYNGVHENDKPYFC